MNNAEPEILLGTSLWIGAWIANESAIRAFNEKGFRKAEGLPPLPTPTVKIASQGAPWFNSLEFTVARVGRKGEERVLTDVNWRDLIPEEWRRRGAQVEDRTGMRLAHVRWAVSPAMAGQLGPGDYRVAATFDTRSSAPPGVAKLLLRSAPAEFRLKRASTDAERAQVILCQARWASEYDGDPARALELAKEAQRLAPGYMDTHDTIGWIYAKQARYRDAINEYTVYLKHVEATEPPSEDGPADVIRRRIEKLRVLAEQQERGSGKGQ